MQKTKPRSPRTVTPRPVADFERAAFRATLSDAGLAIDDLDLPGRDFFSYRDQWGPTVGYAGVEMLGPDALLRSLVVLPEIRNRGYGRGIVERMAAHAAAHGAHALYVLTLRAAPFFEQLNFRKIERSEAPPTIAATTEFAALAPTSAAFMRRDLAASTRRAA